MDETSVLVIPLKVCLKKNYRLRFHKFIKARKQYIFNCKIPYNTCLCGTCKNTFLLARGLNKACKKSIPCNPSAIVEEYSCNSNKKDCMLSICEECKGHGLEQNDFLKKNYKSDENDGYSSSSSNSDGDDDAVCTYYQRKEGADGYLTKIRIETEIFESLTLWQTTIDIMKAHIHTKRRQFTEITRITNNLNEDEILIHLDYSENHKCQHQNEIQSP